MVGGAESTPPAETHDSVAPFSEDHQMRLRHTCLAALLAALLIGCGTTRPEGAVAAQVDALHPNQPAALEHQHQWAELLEEPGLPNLHRVDAGLYRGAQPTAEGMKRLQEMGILTVLNLRSLHSDSDELSGTTLAYEHIRMKAWHIEDEDVAAFLKIVTDPERTPVFVHCQYGADRTGVMCAVYRVVVDGWTKDEAIKEMTEGGFGFHSVYENIIDYVQRLDVEAMRERAGLDPQGAAPPAPAQGEEPAAPLERPGGNGESNCPALSADGRFVAFHSLASNLVPGDTNGAVDVFVHDRKTGKTERVSVSSDGKEGNASSGQTSISADGRFVAFGSFASNLVAGDTNDACDIFVHDRQTGETRKIAIPLEKGEEERLIMYSLSPDGRFVAFAPLVPGSGTGDLSVHDLQTGETEMLSVSPNGIKWDYWSMGSSISAHGRYVAFDSDASNLVPDRNGTSHIFVHDRSTGRTERVSVSSEGIGANFQSGSPCISADGRYVAFESTASNLVPGDTNGAYDVFVRDRQTGKTERVSVPSDGAEGNGESLRATISTHGRHVVFLSYASNLVPGDTNDTYDVFVHDRQTGKTERASVSSNGGEANGDSSFPSLSADGRFVAFSSLASNLVQGDTNGVRDVFVHDRQTGKTERLSVASGEADEH